MSNALEILDTIDIDIDIDPDDLLFKLIDQDGIESTEVLYGANVVPEKNTLEYVLQSAGFNYTKDFALYLNGQEIYPDKYNKEWVYSGSVIEVKPIIHK